MSTKTPLNQTLNPNQLPKGGQNQEPDGRLVNKPRFATNSVITSKQVPNSHPHPQFRRKLKIFLKHFLLFS